MADLYLKDIIHKFGYSMDTAVKLARRGGFPFKVYKRFANGKGPWMVSKLEFDAYIKSCAKKGAREWVRKNQPHKCCSYLYVIGTESGSALKIGVADIIERRLSQLQSGNHEQLSIAAMLMVRTKTEAEQIERRMLASFKDKIIHGEWVCAPLDEVLRRLMDIGSICC